MQTIHSTLVQKNCVQIGPFMRRRADLTNTALAFALQRSRADLPPNDLWLMSLGQLLVDTYGEGFVRSGDSARADDPRLWDQTLSAAKNHAKIAQAIVTMDELAQNKLFQLLMDKENTLASVLSTYGLRDNPLISSQALVDICMQGMRPMHAASSQEVIRVAAVWLRVQDGAADREQGPIGVGKSGHTARLASVLTTRYKEAYLHALLHPGPSESRIDVAVPGARETVKTVVKSLATVACSYASIGMAAALTPLLHVKAALQHPWTTRLLQADTFIRLRDVMAVLDSKGFTNPAWQEWPELTNQNLWDLDLLDPLSFIKGSLQEDSIPSRLTRVVPEPEYPFAPELVGDPRLDADAATVLIDALFAAINRCDEMRRIKDELTALTGETEVRGGSSLTLSVPSREQLRQPTFAAVADGIPLVSRYDLWNAAPPSNLAAVTALKADRYAYYTLAQLHQQMMRACNGYLPVLVNEQRDNTLPVSKPDLLPIFGLLQPGQVRRPITHYDLVRMWNTSEAEMSRTVSNLTPDVTSTTLLALAGSLRFVGLLYLFPVGDAVGRPAAIVMPPCQHWYHSDLAAAQAFLTTYGKFLIDGPETATTRRMIELEKQPNQIDPGGMPYLSLEADRHFALGVMHGGQYELRFAGFSHAISSCFVDSAPRSLRTLEYQRVRPTGSLVRWISRDTSVKKAWEITGWMAADKPIGDIVGVPLSTSIDNYFELQSATDYEPSFLSRVNGLISLIDSSESQQLDMPTIPGTITAEEPIIG